MKKLLHIKSLSLIVLLFSISSCHKNTDSDLILDKNDIIVRIRTSVSSANEENVSNLAQKRNSNFSMQPIVESYLVENSDLEIQATLTPISSQNNLANNTIISKTANKATSNIRAANTTLEDNNTYGLLIFQQNPETFITSKYYVRKGESSTEELKLQKGIPYTIIAFSLNNQSDLRNIVKHIGTGTSISNYKLVLPNTDSAADIDLLYKKFNITIPESATSYDLLVELEHQFNQVSVQVDATNVARDIQNVIGTLNVLGHKNVELNLATGTILRPSSERTARTMPTFNNLNTSEIVSSTANLNSAQVGAGNFLFRLSDLTINNRTVPAKNYFENRSLAKGVKYLITIKVNTNGEGYTDGPIPTVTIGNQTWMRHNLNPTDGYGSNAIPLESQLSVGVHGTYHQHSYVEIRSEADATTPSTSGVNSFASKGWDSNSGTSNPPAKTSKDPCPPGFRVPTPTDFQILFGNVSRSDYGTNFTESQNNFSGGALLKSKSNDRVQIFFPYQGYFEAGSGAPHYIKGRGSLGYYITSYVGPGSPPQIHFGNLNTLTTAGYYATNMVNQPSGPARQVANWGVQMPVKCIKE